MQYQLLLRETLAVLRVRKMGLMAAFTIGVGVGVILFSIPSDVSSTFRTDQQVRRSEVHREMKVAPLQPQRAPVFKQTSDASLAQLEEQERMLIKAWDDTKSAGN